MDTPLEQKRSPDADADERASRELVGLIRKLRWIGMESEAERLQVVLCRITATDSVLATPRDTD